MPVDELRLCDFLFDAGLLARGDLDRAQAFARERGQTLAEALVHSGIVHDDHVRRALAHILGVPFVLLERDDINSNALVLLPEAFSRAHNAVAFREAGTDVEVALLDMATAPTVEAQLPPGRRLLPRFTSKESLTRALLEYQKHLKTAYGSTIAAEVSQLQGAGGVRGNHDAAVRAADALLRHALSQQAEDVHLEPHTSGMRVRYRFGSEIYDAMLLPEAAHLPLLARFATLAGMTAGTTVPRTGRFKLFTDGAVSSEAVAVTVSTVPVIYAGAPAEKMHLALARETEGASGLSLSALGMSSSNALLLRRALQKRSGLVLVCGVSGAGKTTLLYALLDSLQSQGLSAASVEQRVTHFLSHVAQMEQNDELGLSAAACIRAQLKHDPHVLMIDTPLDEESALLATQAANRGTLVLLGVDAASAAEGIEILQSLVPSGNVAAVLEASVGVALFPKLCAESRAPYTLSRGEQHTLEDTIAIKPVLEMLKAEHILEAHTPWKDIQLYGGKECAHCTGGYTGQIGIHEVLPLTRTLRTMIAEDASAEALVGEARSDGALFFAEDALAKAVQGLISAEHIRTE
jgi:type II secretory ATPase GspE/PulE/Tfp pilus assembly ATPase PilB-like protein